MLAGYCPKGAACTHKHLTQRMVKQLEHQQAPQAAAAAAAAAAGMTDVVSAKPRQQQAAAAIFGEVDADAVLLDCGLHTAI